MNRYRQYTSRDDVPEIIGDAAFTALDMRADAVTLPAGVVQVSENFRFDANGAQVRGGISRQVPAGTTVGTIYWAGVYRPDGGTDRIALVMASSLKLFNPADQSIATYNYPGGETVASTDLVDFVQASTGATRTAYICRGTSKTVLKYTTPSTMAVDTGFKQSEWALFYQDRMAAKTGSQTIWVSDFLDWTATGWNVLNEFKVMQGSDDYVVGAMAYQRSYVVVATRKKFLLAYFEPNQSAWPVEANSSFLRILTQEAGLIGRRAWIEAGGLIWFVSDRGIYAFQPQLDLELTVLGEPVSAPIQPIMDRLSASYGHTACVGRMGHRIYFALPIGDSPVTVSTITVASNVATVVSASAHGLAAGDKVQVSNSSVAALNGEVTVASVTNTTTWTYSVTTSDGSKAIGTKCTQTRLATRPNRIAVWNLVNKGWESVDTLPNGLYADWLVTADYGAQRRLWIVDKTNGPALYEDGDVDEIGTVTGGIKLDFNLGTLGVKLSEANFSATDIPGRILSRTYRWGAFARHVRAAESRLELASGDTGTLTATVRTPDRTVWTSTRSWTGSDGTDVAARKRCGQRGLEAEVEINTTGGRPIVRTLQVEMTAAGRVAEE